MPGIGPITIFDKSALQSFNPDEALWFDCFYKTNITPLFYVETLADLHKQMRDGRTPEQIVGSIAYKTPSLGSELNVHHRTLCVNDLLGYPVRMERYPVIGRGRSVMTGDRMGIILERPPEMEAFERWQKGEFLDVERLFAKAWRQSVSGLDPKFILKNFGIPEGQLKLTPSEAKSLADRFVLGERNRFDALRASLEILGVPKQLWKEIIGRWKCAGGPPLCEFAPYAAHVFRVDMFFVNALAAGLISKPTRASNRVDIAYLYYLPFCMVFVSGDNLHRMTAPLFLQKDQVFVWVPDLKADLAKLDAHFSKFPEKVKERGIFEFASNPPKGSDFLTTNLWDRFLPSWRKRGDKNPRRSRKADAELIEKLDAMERAPAAAHTVTTEEASFVISKRLVPVSLGKWRIVSPEVEEKSRSKSNLG